MRKSDKKIDNQLRLALTDVCETALKDFIGFEWLTHVVNYDNFPKTLKIVCVFDTNEHLTSFTVNNQHLKLNALIADKLNGLGIKLNNIAQHISYDSEEDCQKKHQGKWADRL
ncbi:MAG: Fis family transcriptional regulator [Thalassotalea sp.]